MRLTAWAGLPMDVADRRNAPTKDRPANNSGPESPRGSAESRVRPENRGPRGAQKRLPPWGDVMPARVDVKCRRPGPIQPSQIRPLSRPKNAGRYDPHHSEGALVPLRVASATGGSSDASLLRPAPARRPRRGRQAALPRRSVGRPQSGIPQAPTRGAPLLGSRRVGPCQRVYGVLSIIRVASVVTVSFCAQRRRRSTKAGAQAPATRERQAREGVMGGAPCRFGS